MKKRSALAQTRQGLNILTHDLHCSDFEDRTIDGRYHQFYRFDLGWYCQRRGDDGELHPVVREPLPEGYGSKEFDERDFWWPTVDEAIAFVSRFA